MELISNSSIIMILEQEIESERVSFKRKFFEAYELTVNIN